MWKRIDPERPDEIPDVDALKYADGSAVCVRWFREEELVRSAMGALEARVTALEELLANVKDRPATMLKRIELGKAAEADAKLTLHPWAMCGDMGWKRESVHGSTYIRLYRPGDYSKTYAVVAGSTPGAIDTVAWPIHATSDDEAKQIADYLLRVAGYSMLDEAP